MIVSAALRFRTTDGKEHVTPLHRHADGFFIISDFGIPYIKSSVEQGFINSEPDGEQYSFEFVDRISAKKIAAENHQLLDPDNTYGELFSEDLW